MNSLDRFIEPIKVAGNPISGDYKAYRMDGTGKNNDMRKMVGLGTCHCCDYFQSEKDFIILIKETQLLKKVENIREEYGYLNDEDMDKAVNNRIRERMQLKAYGAMLVLCRLAEKCVSAKNLIQNKKYHFWLVASSINSAEEKIFFDNLKDSLRGKLNQVLGKTLLDNVDVFSSETLKKKLSENAAAP